MALEARENPAIPTGLSNLTALLPAVMSPDYIENHSVTQAEGNTVTVDQAGTGSAGTFSIDAVGLGSTGDTAVGSGQRATAHGTGTSQFSYHSVISGTYANGTYTVTNAAYTAFGSYTISQDSNVVLADFVGGSSIHDKDSVLAGTYSESWTAAASGGQLLYTSYTRDQSETTHSHDRMTYSNGGYTDTVNDASRSRHSVLNGANRDTTGSDSWHLLVHSYLPSTNGAPSEFTFESSDTTPYFGSMFLGARNESVAATWNAGSLNATGYSFHGVSSESSNLTEAASFHSSLLGGMRLDVDSFSSVYHASDSAHVVDDEPEPNAGGASGSFHRDELFVATNDATGSGSYVNGGANANYHAVEMGNSTVADSLVSINNHSTGVDEDGESFDLLFNYSGSISAGAGATNIHDYHDLGMGLELTSSSFTGAGGGSSTTRTWGARNGTGYDDTNTATGGWNAASAFAGEPGAVSIPDGLVGAFPFNGSNFNGIRFVADTLLPWWAPTSPVPGLPGQVQNFYNHRVDSIGAAAKKKVVKDVAKTIVMQALHDNNPGNPFPKPYGNVTLGSAPGVPLGPGQAFAAGIGEGESLASTNAQNQKLNC